MALWILMLEAGNPYTRTDHGMALMALGKRPATGADHADRAVMIGKTAFFAPLIFTEPESEFWP